MSERSGQNEYNNSQNTGFIFVYFNLYSMYVWAYILTFNIFYYYYIYSII